MELLLDVLFFVGLPAYVCGKAFLLWRLESSSPTIEVKKLNHLCIEDKFGHSITIKKTN